jgi:uncharacterized protein
MKFNYSDSNKRYHTLDYYNKQRYGHKVFKVSLNAGFSCPNKDGTKGYGGCTFCSLKGSGDFAGDVKLPLDVQFHQIKDIILKKWPNSKYIAYFQANTNTYAPLDKLKSIYEPILKIDNVIGISIGTRPDSITEDVMDYLEQLNKKTDLTIELGLQTIHDSTSKLVNLGYTKEEFEDTLKELKKRNIKVVVHIINGLPYETKEMMLETTKHLNTMPIDGIKIHMLHIIKDTVLAELYDKTKFKVLTKEEYVDIVCDQLELLNEEIVIHRITGDPNVEDLIEPYWLVKKFGVLNEIDKEMVKRDSYQGKRTN